MQARYYGKVHGEMEYKPAGPSVYLSRHEHSNNLNTALFEDNQEDPVIVLEIDGSYLDQEKIYPDEALFYFIDEAILPDPDLDPNDPGFKEEFMEAATDFAIRYGMSLTRARQLLMRFFEDDGSNYPEISREMWRHYLAVDGEIAYLGDIPPQAILGWHYHPNTPNPAPEETVGHTRPRF